MSKTDAGLSDLPDGWAWTTLGEIIKPSKEKVNPLEIKEIPYISLEHIEKGAGRLLGHGSSNDVRSSKTKFNCGDLLYGKLRPYLNKVYISDFEGVCSTDLLVFPKNESFSNEFLLYRFLCRDFVSYASHNVSGVNLPRVNFQTLSRFKLYRDSKSPFLHSPNNTASSPKSKNSSRNLMQALTHSTRFNPNSSGIANLS